MIAGGFGLYIHWPFCRSKCPYCDFNSHVRAAIDQDRWRSALLAELNHWIETCDPQGPVETIFFGGGTPSLMAAQTADALIALVDQRLGFGSHPEITLEANPTSVESETFADFKSAGINRFSLGIQALDDSALKFLGREHSVDEALRALNRAIETGNRLSFDLIYARPGQTLDEWRSELTRALDFGTEHLSLYQLTLEPGTAFTRAAERGELVLPDDDLAADMFELTSELTNARGLPAYEVSNHARPGSESRHNLIYWRGGAYIGIGPGAHGRVMVDGQRHASVAQRTPEDWLRQVESQGHGRAELTPLSANDQAEEYLLMGLRLSEGIDQARFERLAGRSLDLAGPIADGLIKLVNGKVAATPAGRLVLNRLIASLI